LTPSTRCLTLYFIFSCVFKLELVVPLDLQPHDVANEPRKRFFEQEAHPMGALKLAFVSAGLLALITYGNVYYHTSEFDDFVRHEAQRTRLKNQLKQEILNRASAYSVHVRENDISITTTGAVFRVAVDYRVPIDLFVYSHELRFQTIGSGLLRE